MSCYVCCMYKPVCVVFPSSYCDSTESSADVCVHEVTCWCCDVRSSADGASQWLDGASAASDEVNGTSVNGAPAGLTDSTTAL